MATKGERIQQIVDKEDLRAMATAGMTPAQVATYFGMSRPNFLRLMKENLELKEAFQEGLQHVIIKATRVLMNRLDNNDLIAALFVLKARAGWIEQQYVKEKPDTSNAPNVVVYLPENHR